ncbi:MAG: hypothetical protein AB2813_13640 [Candidatus Sedimenticola endophacoides]
MNDKTHTEEEAPTCVLIGMPNFLQTPPHAADQQKSWGGRGACVAEHTPFREEHLGT